MIFKTVYRWEKPYQFKSHWSTYYQNDIESPKYLKDKEATIRRWLEIIKPKSILDLGSNTGKFSFIAAEYAKKVISLEVDTISVDKIEEQINLRKLDNVYTLIGNIAESSPMLGLMNNEVESIYSRTTSDLVLGLALSHHFYFSNKLSFNQIVLLFSKFCNRYLIVEFVDINDNKVQLIIKDKTTNIKEYDEFHFTKAISRQFAIKEIVRFNNSKRSLLLLEKNNCQMN
jgi:SAM-dependent methyltransferase